MTPGSDNELSAQQILGNYVVLRELGRGGMGVVYLGQHQTLGKRAAIKVLLPELSKHEDLVHRFVAEARTVTAIKHPSIVDVYDHGTTDDGRAFIVMEHLEGESLASRLKARGLLPIPQAIAIARQVAHALSAAHAVGVVHRDLKPDNVHLVPDPEVAGGERAKLLDFGVAKLVADETTTQKTVTGAILGTPQYMSPEQCEGARAVDHRSDLYSLGCMVFQMVSGRLPFESKGIGGVIGMHLHVPAPKLRDRAPHASLALEAIVARLLAKQPDERFASGTELAAALADPSASEVDAAASAPLPQQTVDANLATEVSRFDKPRIPPRITDDPVIENAKTLPAVKTDVPTLPAKKRKKYFAASAILASVALFVVAGSIVGKSSPPNKSSDNGALTLAVPDAGVDSAPLRARDPVDEARELLEKMNKELERKQWVAAGQLGKQVLALVPKGSPQALEVHNYFANFGEPATRDVGELVEKLAANNECDLARTNARTFASDWPVKSGLGVWKRARRCLEGLSRVEWEAQMYVAIEKQAWAEGYVSCTSRASRLTSDDWATCSLFACGVEDLELALSWFRRVPVAQQDALRDKCQAAREHDNHDGELFDLDEPLVEPNAGPTGD